MLTRLILLSVLLFSTCVSAQNYSLKVNLKDGSSQEILLADIQKITFSQGITSISDFQKLKTVLKTFTLFQNYPNPFNPSTKIEYQLPKAGQVEISIFDLNGRRVRKFFEGQKKTGTCSVVWDGNNEHGQKCASGLYVCQVKFENLLQTKKMLLIK